MLNRLMVKKYQINDSCLPPLFKGLKQDDLFDLGEKIIEWDSFDEVKYWINQQKQKNLNS